MNAAYDISVIIPVFNEGASVHTAFNTITAEMQKHDSSFELIFVDDGSMDDSFAHLKQISANRPHVKALKLTTNCGSHMAIRAGLAHATGACACFIACDMQEPPSLIHQLKAELNDEFNIVWAVRNSRRDHFMTILFAKMFYWLSRKMVTNNIPPSGASMFMVSSKVIHALNLYDERNLTLEGLFATMGFKNAYIYYDREKRKTGVSKWTVSKKIKLFIDFFVAYSNIPIRMVSILGISFSLVGFIWTLYVIFRTIFFGDLPVGWPALISVLLIGFGVTNISLGVIAEYLWRALDEARKRPKYIIEKKINL